MRGVEPALELLARVRQALPPGYPVWLAGGIADAADVRAALDAGAEAVVAGTRFLLSEESRAHPEYKRRALAGRETVLTELFGAGWPASHRVLPNAATARWLGGDPRGPGWMRALHRATAPLARRLPDSLNARLAAAQRPGTPMLSPLPPADDAPLSLLESGPLYAGESVARIDRIAPAGELVVRLAG